MLPPNLYWYGVDARGQRLPYLDKLVFLIVPDMHTASLHFQSGELEALDNRWYAENRRRGNFTFHDLGPMLGVNYLVFNSNRVRELEPGRRVGEPYVTPTKDAWFREVRRAVSHAIDRDAIIRSAFLGEGVKNWSTAAVASKVWYTPDVTGADYDLAETMQLLANMSFLDRDASGVLEDDHGNSLSFTLKANADNPARMQMGTFIRDDLVKVGNRCVPHGADFNTLVGNLRDDFQYKAILLGLQPGVPPDPAMEQNFYKSSGTAHAWNINQPRPEAEAEALFNRECFMVWLPTPRWKVPIRNTFGNLGPTVIPSRIPWNIDPVCLKQVGPSRTLGRPRRRGPRVRKSRDADTHAIGLIGREREMRTLTERIEAANGTSGGALLIRGAVGIGKSSLLKAARSHAAERRFQILTTTGIQSESHLPFAGLHQLLRPVLHEVDRLPDSYGKAIRTAFGLSDETAPSPYLIALSILHLLGECAESAPVLLLVDDAHWLDLPTAEALAFVTRRLESDPIVLITTMRDGFKSPFLEAGLPELRVEELSDEEAALLLDARVPGLTPALRDRIMKEAAGNPLALVELSVALDATADADPLSTARLQLSDRLELAFAGRLLSLTPGTRRLLHVAAADENGVLAQLMSAACKLVGHEITLESTAEAEAAGLVEIDGPHLRFRHPLMRSAIHQAMSLEERQAVHAALAATLDDDPDRRAWHRAAAAVGKNEPVAAELEAAAVRAERRGATIVALEALERAAQLADDPARRGNRLVHAAYLASDLGRQSEVLRLLKEVNDMELGPPDLPQVAWLRELFAQGSWSGASRIASFVEIADKMRVEGDVDDGLEVLMNISLRCWWSNPDEETRARMIAVAEQFPVPENDARLISVIALAGPVERGAVVVERLSRRWTELLSAPGSESYPLGLAAQAVGDFVHSEQLMEAHIIRCRTHGWLGRLQGALVSQAWNKVHRGDWKQASFMASEAGRLQKETGQANWTHVADLAAATIAAYRGDVAAAETLSSAGEQALLPRGANPLLALVLYPRGGAALADGRYDEAYQHLKRIFDPADSAYHPHIRSWVLVDLVEAAVHSGHEDEAAAFMSDLERVATRTRSPLLQAGLEFARPVLSPDDEAAFQASLGAGLASWPFIRARLQLAYGLWLRRQRRAADSRTPLRAARDAFDALGAVPWGERARQELRASGETSRRRTYDLSDMLSPQELQIAQMAAAGLSNKEIGQQLFLSHRTISSHLYRIFPKLGITARSHLRAALHDRSTPTT